MVENKNFKISNEGHLIISDCDTVDLAKKYDTPVYIVDETVVRENCKLYKNSIDKYYGGRGLALYASKALCTMAIYKIIEQEGLGIDVVSGGELYTAIKAKFPMDKIYFHGNNKTEEELSLAIDNNIGCIVVDNKEELNLLNRLCDEKRKKANIQFRIKPGVEAHTHEFIQTGQIDSKFGVALENGEAHELFEYATKLANLNIIGVHCHIGSQIFDLEPFQLAAKIMLGFIADMKAKHNVEMTELNLGGGFGIKYTDEDDPIEYDKYIKSVSEVVKSECEKLGIKQPNILMEPGRSIIAPAGITLYTVGGVKEIKGIRKYISVDGGMCDNPRYALYESKYDMSLANKANLPKDDLVTVAGKCCETGDLLGKDVKIQQAEAGDILVVYATGAYNYSMSMNYNRHGKLPVVLVKDGKDRLIVKREDFEDIVRNDLIPEDLI